MSIQVNPVRRNIRFGLPHDRATNWNPLGLHVTQFFNSLSVFFPVGERFFIHSLRNYRDAIQDPQLKEQIAAFIGQEAFHGREHEEYNELLAQAGLPAERMEQLVTRVLETAKQLPPPMQLAATVALEHLTALLGDMLLRDPRLMEGAEPHFHALWRWHALEETEHKAVSFDVFNEAVGTGPRAYALRVGVFLLANAIFWSLFYPFYYRMVKASGGQRDLKGWLSSINFQFGSLGALRRIAPEWLDFLRPGFHPWMHDNRALLKQLDTLAEEVDRLNSQPSRAKIA